jgi:hypothetical protein
MINCCKKFPRNITVSSQPFLLAGTIERFHCHRGVSRYDVDDFYTNADADHFKVCRPQSWNSSSFLFLSNFISDVLEQDKESSEESDPKGFYGWDKQVRFLETYRSKDNHASASLEWVGLVKPRWQKLYLTAFRVNLSTRVS